LGQCTYIFHIEDRKKGFPLDFASVSWMDPVKKHWIAEYTNESGNVHIVQPEGTAILYKFQYLGYSEKTMHMACPDSTKQRYNVALDQRDNTLDEVIITEKFPAIVEKKDTVIYKISEFTSGNESKLKEVLNKLPGIHVDRSNIVTYNGERVKELLVENDKFFTGDPSLGVKYIPADAVDKVEVLEKHNPVKVLQGHGINDKLALNIRLKENKKKFVFGEGQVGSNFDSRHEAHNSSFYYSPSLTVNNILDASTTAKEAVSRQELFRILGMGEDNFDPRTPMRMNETNNMISAMVSVSDVYDKKAIFGIQHIRYVHKKKFSVEAIGLGLSSKSWSSMENTKTYPSNILSDQKTNVTSIKNNSNKFGTITLATNPQKNYFLTYQYTYADHPLQAKDSSENWFEQLKNTMAYDASTDNREMTHTAKWIQQWHKKVQTITIGRYHENTSSHHNLSNIRGGFVPSIYQVNANAIKIRDQWAGNEHSTYFLYRININLSPKMRLNVHYRWDNAQYLVSGNVAGQDLTDMRATEKSISTFDNKLAFNVSNIVVGSRFAYADQLNEVRIGMDYLALDLARNLPLVESQKYMRFAPRAEVLRSVGGIGRLGLFYTYDLMAPTIRQLNPALKIAQFNLFSVGNAQLKASDKNTYGISLKRQSSQKGSSKIFNLSYSYTHLPILSGFDYNGSHVVETFYNSDKSKKDLNFSVLYIKMTTSKTRIINHFISSYSLFYQKVVEDDIMFRQMRFSDNFQFSKTYKHTELTFEITASITNIPYSHRTEWIRKVEFSMEFGHFFNDHWSVNVNPSFGKLFSSSLNQANFPLHGHIQYKTKNEKIKIMLQGYNLLNQTTDGSSYVSQTFTSTNAIKIFPRYGLVTFTYVY
jgi:hypothetical protein